MTELPFKRQQVIKQKFAYFIEMHAHILELAFLTIRLNRQPGEISGFGLE